MPDNMINSSGDRTDTPALPVRRDHCLMCGIRVDGPCLCVEPIRPRGATYVAIVPEGVDFDWCPNGCGGTTEDPYGGPCAACWREICNDREGRYS